MPVLINDLEVELQSSPAETESESRPSVDSSDRDKLSPGDMSIILMQQAERQERVRAH